MSNACTMRFTFHIRPFIVCSSLALAISCKYIIHNWLKTSKKFLYKIFPVHDFPYLCLPNKWG